MTCRKVPPRFEAAVFRWKTVLLQIRRAFRDLLSGRARFAKKSDNLAAHIIISQSRTSLWTETGPEERFQVAGKIHNLRLAIRELDGVEVPANQIFSFWKHVGRASRFRGYVEGGELREG